MTKSSYASHVEPNWFAQLTSFLFGLVPMSLTMIVLRIALAIPFWMSGLTRWDGWFTLSFGTKIAFESDLKLHILGAEFPYPFPDQLAYAAATCEILLPILLVLGLFTRYAALGLLGMTAVIELTFPELEYFQEHLHWAAMALAILTFGPGRIALDWWLGLDRQSRPL